MRSLIIVVVNRVSFLFLINHPLTESIQMNNQASHPGATDTSEYVKSLSQLVKAHPSVLYAQAVLRPSLALAQGHSLSLIQGLKVRVVEYRLASEMPGFDAGMRAMLNELQEQADRDNHTLSLEEGERSSKGRSTLETLRVSLRDNERVLMVVLYSNGMMIQHRFGALAAETIVADFCRKFEPVEKGVIHYMTAGDGGLGEVREENTDPGDIVDEAYPMLMEYGGATTFIDNFLADDSAILNFYGIPGSGKSTLMRKAASRSQGRHVMLVDNPLIYRDPKLAAELISRVRTLSSEGKRPMLLLEEVDKYVQEKSEGNDFLIQLLSLSSGVLKTDVKIVLASNLTNADKVLEALQRSGRSFGNVEFIKLSTAEAAKCRFVMKLEPRAFTHPVNLADVLCTQVHNVGTNKAKLGFTS